MSTLLIDIWLRRFEVRQEVSTRFVEFAFTRMTPEWGTGIAKIAHSNLLRASDLATDPELQKEVQATLKRYTP